MNIKMRAFVLNAFIISEWGDVVKLINRPLSKIQSAQDSLWIIRENIARICLNAGFITEFYGLGDREIVATIKERAGNAGILSARTYIDVALRRDNYGEPADFSEELSCREEGVVFGLCSETTEDGIFDRFEDEFKSYLSIEDVSSILSSIDVASSWWKNQLRYLLEKGDKEVYNLYETVGADTALKVLGLKRSVYLPDAIRKYEGEEPKVLREQAEEEKAHFLAKASGYAKA